MIGKTNIPMGMPKGETVSILLKTNQSSNEDLNGVKVVVSYGDESHEYAYNGQFSIEIPKDKTYTVSFGEVNGYKTPSSVTYTAVKGFSRSIEATYYGEKVTVNVSAEEGASVDGQAVKVSKSPSIDDGEEYPIVNGRVSFSVPYDETYTVSVSDMDGYVTPEARTYTASQPTRSIDMNYTQSVEHVVVNVSADDGTSMDGKNVNVRGLTIGLETTHTIIGGKVEFDIPTGAEYTISVDDVDGYTTPEPQSFVAESGTRTVNMVYEAVKLGVFIATQGGQLVSPDIWISSNGTPVGVALITYNSSYIIGLDATQKERIAWSSNESIDLSNVPTSTNGVTIATYYDGVSYTDAMIAAGAEYNTTSYAAGYVRSKSISFGGNILTGYLGSAGEWQDALNNYQAIMDAFAKIGDTFATDGNGFLTSCESSSKNCWYAYWVRRNPLLQFINKSATVDGLYVVPFFKI